MVVLLGMLLAASNKNKGKAHGKNKSGHRNKSKKYNSDKVLKRFTLENQ